MYFLPKSHFTPQVSYSLHLHEIKHTSYFTKDHLRLSVFTVLQHFGKALSHKALYCWTLDLPTWPGFIACGSSHQSASFWYHHCYVTTAATSVGCRILTTCPVPTNQKSFIPFLSAVTVLELQAVLEFWGSCFSRTPLHPPWSGIYQIWYPREKGLDCRLQHSGFCPALSELLYWLIQIPHQEKQTAESHFCTWGLPTLHFSLSASYLILTSAQRTAAIIVWSNYCLKYTISALYWYFIEGTQ